MTKYGVFEIHPRIHAVDAMGQFPSRAEAGAEIMLARIAEEIKKLSALYKITGIAISSAGQINHLTGEVIFATDTIPGYTGQNPKKKFEEAFGVPVSVDNDVNCFLLGERYLGALEGSVVCVALGTGIGGAIYLNGDVYRGASGSAGEFGHMQLIKGGRPCTCGSNGCFEQYASSRALAERVAETFPGCELPEFFEKCKRNDAVSNAVLEAWLDGLTDGLKNLIHIFNPETLLIGGAIAKQGEFLETLIKKHLMPKLMPSYVNCLKVKVSEYGNKSTLYGATYHHVWGEK